MYRFFDMFCTEHCALARSDADVHTMHHHANRQKGSMLSRKGLPSRRARRGTSRRRATVLAEGPPSEFDFRAATAEPTRLHVSEKHPELQDLVDDGEGGHLVNLATLVKLKFPDKCRNARRLAETGILCGA